MHQPFRGTVTLKDILITEALLQRSPRTPNWQAEAEAMRTLMRQMASSSDDLLQSLANTAVDLCQAGAAGVSLLETTPEGETVFRWNVLAGTFAHHVGGSTPRNFSPCGVCLDQGAPVLLSHPERYFTYLQAADTPIVEGLVLPLIADSHLFGTIWIVSHDEVRQFDSEDVRVMTSLADFTATALLLQQRQAGELLAANAVLETEILERKQVEEQTRALITNLPGGAVFMLDRDLRYLLAEGETFSAMGFKLEDVVGRTIFEVLPPDLAASYAPMYRQALAGEPFEHEHNAHNRTYISRGTPLRSPDGEVYAVLVVFFDLTERKRTEAALQESEERFRTLADTAPALIWFNDAQGNNRFINQHCLDFTGKSAEQIRGEGWHELVHPDDAKPYIASYLAAVRQQQPWHSRNRIRRHDGVWRWHDNYARPLFSPDGVYLGHVGVTIDNTEAIEAEIALQESEQRYRYLVELTPYLVWNADEQGRNTYVSSQMSAHLGLPSGQLLNLDWQSTIHPEDVERIHHRWMQSVQTGHPYEAECRLRGASGEYRWHLVRAVLEENDQGRKWFGVSTDIHDRKRREANLAFLADITEDFSHLSTADEIMQAVGAKVGAYLNLTNCLFAEINEAQDRATIEHTWHTLDTPSVTGVFRLSDFITEELRQTARSGETIIICDTQTDPRTDSDRYAALKIHAFVTVPFYREGTWKYIFTVNDSVARSWREDEIELIREVTNRTFPRLERAYAEQALRESQQRLSVIFAQAAVGLSEISLDGRFLQVNDALCQMLGRSRKNLLTSTVFDTTFADDSPRSSSALHQLLATGETVSLDQRYFRPDGSVLWVNSILTSLTDEQGNPERILAVTVDLSDRIRAEMNNIQLIREQAAREEERKRAEHLAELDRTKIAFFSNVSHEFRTPLTLILEPLEHALAVVEEWRSGSVGMQDGGMMGEWDDETNPAVENLPVSPSLPVSLPNLQEQLQLAHRNSLRLLKLVNTLLDFSRIEAGRVQTHYEPTDLAAYTANLASVFRSAIAGAKLNYIVDCPPLPEPVYVDREMWEKIVFNLLSNALKFTFEGEIEISLRWVEESIGEGRDNERISQRDDANDTVSHPPTVQLSVRDTGAGIPENALPHLFKRFYQVEGAGGRSDEGSGIGLSLVQELVKLHGGTITVSSQVNQGTTFTITLPTGTAHLPVDRIRVPSQAGSTVIDSSAYVEEALRWLPEKRFRQSQQTAGITENQAAAPESNFPFDAANTLPRLLLVDDNADMRDYLKQLLSQYYEVEAVGDGLAALRAIAHQIPDLVLTDVMMPGIDGFELLRSLRSQETTREMPIILLSARAGQESRLEGLQAGADDYLIKPFSARELLAKVNVTLKLARMRREAAYREQVMQEMEKLNTALEQRVQARTMQLQAINQELEAFSSTVSHDLRTPLQYILSVAELLHTRFSRSGLDEASLRYLSLIVQAARAAGTMVDDLLEFSHMGQVKIRFTQVSMNTLVQQVLEQLQPELTGRKICWQIAPLPDVQADATLLHLVMQNLLSNAIKYTRDRIPAEITVGSIEHEQETVFYVRDNGAGFDMKYRHRLFSIFKRLHPQEEFEGTGVGLANVRRIIHRHGGQTWAKGEIDQGATFYFSLPKSRGEEP